ncbi:MAG: hypothetical protein XD76_0796 [candidate division TA06 bacterium 32_111]|uniref:Uncharacterized protein n=2 Tax=Bacteria candidate phyla TaxID=1783234 RepID=A0A117M796_UNCT6|nr:MAG: hypothetical protein XD76_0796 [candidate division TA06 bacterium 32_111]KUK88252.1 MAG: hypothetical protein XE03_0258 [candidate division TA06 bacterium 34_109]HAF07185.1 hypothetical protein [candidate division WOR-3 bacterium]HCP16036.1 hypothetical protein [candidate division WOR-3 bacterium]
MKSKIFFLSLFFLSIKVFPSFEDLLNKLDFYEDTLQTRIDSTLLSDYYEKTVDYMVKTLKSSNWYFKTISLRILKKVEDKESLISKLFEEDVERIYIMRIFEDDTLDPYKDLDFYSMEPYEYQTYISYIGKKNKFETLVKILSKENDDYLIVKILQSLNGICLKDTSYAKSLYSYKDIFAKLIGKKNIRLNKSISLIFANFFSDSLDVIFNGKILNDIPTFSLYVESATLSGKRVELEKIEKFYNGFRTKDFYYLDYILKSYFEKFSIDELKEIKENLENKSLKDIIKVTLEEKDG